MTRDTRDSIVSAFISLANQNPQCSSFTMSDIAKEAGISRQAIYQKHFNNFDDIINYIHEKTDQHIFQIFSSHCSSQTGNPIKCFADYAIPSIYEHREMIRTLFVTQADPSWTEFLRNTYSKWVLQNVHYSKAFHFSEADMTYIITNIIIAFIEAWIRKENPTPPEEFKKTFLLLTTISLQDYMILQEKSLGQ